MVQIFYYKHCEIKLEDWAFKALLQQFPLFIQEEVLRYKRWQDRQRSLFGKCLLNRALQSLHFDSGLLYNLKYNSYKRPYLEAVFDFNISHSGDIAICAISDTCKIGIDIEKIQPVEIDHYNIQLSEMERQQIKKADDSNRTFFNTWTKKESFIKAIGKGLSHPLNMINTENNKIIYKEQEWTFHRIELLKEYVCHLCISTSSPLIVLKEIKF